MNTYKANKSFSLGIVLIFMLMAGFFTFLLCNSIYFYSDFDLDYSDLIYEELTFDKYESKHVYRGSTRYEVYFKEYEKSFELSTISNRKLDKKALDDLGEGEILKVYYRETASKNFDYVICEFGSDTTVLLSLVDYVNTNQNNQLLGMIISPLFILFSLFVIYVSIRYEKIMSKDRGLGKIKLEYIVGDNVIRVYNSLSTCSLVINDKVVDEYCGLIGYNFILDGKVKINGRKIPVEARMGHVNIRLYYDGKLVGKKFMGFG